VRRMYSKYFRLPSSTVLLVADDFLAAYS